MLHVHDDGLTDLTVRDLPSLLRRGDILVANDTRVFPAQLQARRGDARIGITLDRPRRGRRLERPGAQRPAGAASATRWRSRMPPALTATVTDKTADGSIGLRFNLDGDALMQAFEQAGALALPPYIHRPDGPTAQRCQRLPDDLCPPGRARSRRRRRGCISPRNCWRHRCRGRAPGRRSRCMSGSAPSCRCGWTASPITGCTPSAAIVTAATAEAINQARRDGGRVVAVGTTSLRLLESAAVRRRHGASVHRRDGAVHHCPATGSGSSTRC